MKTVQIRPNPIAPAQFPELTVDCDEARRMGWRIRRLRDAQGKSLQVIAGLAGMSTTHLWRIEVGQRSPNLAQIAALADALQITPAELGELRAPAPSGHQTDSTVQAVRLAVAVLAGGPCPAGGDVADPRDGGTGRA